MAANAPESAGNDRVAPTSRKGGAMSLTMRSPVAVAPAQLRIHAVIWSAQAASLASQQLCPEPTLVTSREPAGSPRFTRFVAAW